MRVGGGDATRAERPVEDVGVVLLEMTQVGTKAAADDCVWKKKILL